MDLSASKLDLLARVLDAASTRHQVIAHNVANVNTPGFKRQDVAFEEELAKAVEEGADPRTVPITIVEDASAPARADGNTVDIDKEMGNLTKNSLLYSAAAQIMAAQLSALRSAITGR